MDADDIFMKKEELMAHLENKSNVFKNKAVQKAFEAVDRKDFIHEDYKVEAYEDYAVPTLKGQTISQPTTVAFMLELLDAQPGNTVLDIGSGSGWMTALLAHMVGTEGMVYGIEIIPELVAAGKENLKNYKELASHVEILLADEEVGLASKGPYERIISSAAFSDKNDALAELFFQLAHGGVMVVPIGQSIFKFEKTSDDDIAETEYPGFSFVPYIE